MNRILQPHAEAIAEARRYIPHRFLELAGCDVFCGDPFFAQLYHPGQADRHPQTGRSYRELCHVAYEHHCKDKRVTMVLPREPSPLVVVHEFGHVLHSHLGWRNVPRLEPVSDYAHLNRHEEFAEAFALYCCYWPEALDRFDGQSWWKWSRPNAEFFKRLLRD